MVVTQRSLVNCLAHARDAYPSTRMVSLLHSPVSADLTVTSLLAPLVAGGCVHAGDLRDGRSLPGGGRLSGVFVTVTPSHLPLLDELGLRDSRGDLVVGGEQLTGELLTQWRDGNPAVAVVNEYGPTEATVGCVTYQAGPG